MHRQEAREKAAEIPQGQINRYNGGKNGVLRFILGDFDPASPHHGRFEGQLKGNHFTYGITVYGFKRILVIIQWGKYQRDRNHFATGDHNGYDLCEHVRVYMRKIGKPQMSLIEAIVSGEVEELLCLQSEVGPADGFFSHVQAVPVADTVVTLEDAEKRYEEALMVDKEAVAALRRKALEDWVQEKCPENEGCVSEWISSMSPVAIEERCKLNFGSAPTLASITAMKKHSLPRLFVDYFNIRQCIKNDFATDRLVDAIATIGVTLVELGADFRADSALLKRSFCVLELFATVKTKGKLLVCGPALGDAATTKELAMMAVDREWCQEVMDSSSSRTRSAEAEAEIKAYIERTVGFARTDRVVLSAIVASCVLGVESAFDAMDDRGGSVLLAAGCMLEEVGDYNAAQILAEGALAKVEAAYGEGAYETAEAVYMLAKLQGATDSGIMPWYKRSLQMAEEEHGKEHAATARSLVGIGKMQWLMSVKNERMSGTKALRSGANFKMHHPDGSTTEYLPDGSSITVSADGNTITKTAKGLECINLAIARIEAADCPSDHADTHADALLHIATMQGYKKEYQEALEWSERSVRVLESKYGPDHLLTTLYACALGTMATMYANLGDPEKGMALQLRVLRINEEARGRLSFEAGQACQNIGSIHYSAGRYSEAALWLKKAVEAMGYTNGPAATSTVQCQGYLKYAIAGMDRTDAKAQEYRRFLEESEELANPGMHAKRMEQARQAMEQARQMSTIVLEGQEEGDLQHCLMGVYKLLEGKEVNGRGVWKRIGMEEFLYYSEEYRWGIGDDEDLVSPSTDPGWMSVTSTALTPDRITETWRVGDGSGDGRWYDAPNARVRA
jgi:tetratricopeptide (TPR) repeat protein